MNFLEAVKILEDTPNRYMYRLGYRNGQYVCGKDLKVKYNRLHYVLNYNQDYNPKMEDYLAEDWEVRVKVTS